MKVEVNYIATKIIEIDDNLKDLNEDEIADILSKKMDIHKDDILNAYDENNKCLVDFYF